MEAEMPRYAKKSLDAAIYDDILACVKWDERNKIPATPHPSERAVVALGVAGVTQAEKLRAIKSIARCQDMGWIDPEAALMVIGKISTEG
jgi:hypothetical protein